MSGTFERSMRVHEESAQRHEAAAVLWDNRDQAERADFERRCAHIEREAAQLDAERSELERLRAGGPAQADAATRAEIDRLTREIERRGAQLLASDGALEHERARLWRPMEQSLRSKNAATERDAAAAGRRTTASAAAETALGAAGRLAAQTRESAGQLSSVLIHTANALETSAALADAHAERLERGGQADAGAEERRAADRARAAAQRARSQAKERLDFALRRPH